MTTIPFRALACAALLAAAPAQEAAHPPKPTAAEQAFRDARWAESGKGDLDGALAQYLAAAAADGPAGVRGKALLHAGALQQRLGKTDAAIATLRQVLKAYPGEAEVVEQARAHLRELTAVDLTTGYDEWYERRLFSEEVQLQVLAKLDAVAKALAAQPAPGDADAARRLLEERQVARRAVLAYGKGAVPALRKASESGDDSLAEAAVEMLFDLGQVPPLAALRRRSDWTYDPNRWCLLLATPTTAPAAAAPGASSHDRLLAAATAGARSLADALFAERFQEGDTCARAIGIALLQHDDESRRLVRAALARRDVPVATRIELHGALIECDPAPPFDAAEWLAIGEDPMVFDLRGRAIRMAAQLLGERDGAVLDELLARVAAASPTWSNLAFSCLLTGLRNHGSPLLVPWNAERLRLAMTVASRTDAAPDADFVALVNLLRGDAELRAMLAEAVLGAPLALHAVFIEPPPDRQPNCNLGALFSWDGVEQRQAEVLAARWHGDLAAVLARSWTRWSDAERKAVLAIVSEVVTEVGRVDALREFFAAVRRDANPALHAVLDATLTALQR